MDFGKSIPEFHTPLFKACSPSLFNWRPRTLPHEFQPMIEAQSESLIGMHIPRVAAIPLRTLTEIQAYFRFDGAHINQRLHKIWDEHRIVPEIKELYDERYAKLMQDQGINPA